MTPVFADSAAAAFRSARAKAFSFLFVKVRLLNMGSKFSRLLTTTLKLFLVVSILFPSVSNITQTSASQSNYSLTEADSLWVVVNKQNPLNPLKYEPADLITPHFGTGLNSNPYGRKLRKDAAYASIALAKAMNSAGQGALLIQSGYRSFAEQTSVHDRQVSAKGLEIGEALAARPGYSEHQTGLAMDVSARGQGCQIRVCFGNTKAGTWLRQNSYRYGFIIRYPQGSTPYTGYQYEPWHLRFVGVELATSMHDKGFVTLEKYFKLPAAPTYPQLN